MKTPLFLIISFGFLLFVMGSCEEKGNNSLTICECNNNTNTTEVKDLEGIINYDNNTNTWNIIFHEPNTYDNVEIFVPCNIQSEYKKNNLHVQFSGIVFKPLVSLQAPAGSKYLCIKLISITTL